MKARIKWNEQASFVGESGSGHAIVLDGAPEHGGRNLGIRPMEAVLLGLGACSAFDVVQILKKARQPIRDCYVELEAMRADAVPAVFTHIHMGFVIQGQGLNASRIARAVSLSVERYCSAAAMLRPGVDIDYDWRIEEPPSAD